MHTLISLLALALLAIGALAAPTPTQQLSKRTFTIPINRHARSHRSPAQEMVRTYRKYGWQIVVLSPEELLNTLLGGLSSVSAASAATVPASSVAPISAASAPATSEVAVVSSASYNASSYATAASPTAASPTAASPTAVSPSAAYTAAPTSNENGEVAATPEENESEYLSPVSIGGQKLNLDFDTGSADLWVFSNSLPASESQGHSTFNPSKSTTWQEYKGASWKIAYGDGSGASGAVGYDTVDIGGATATRQAVEIATAVSGSFVSDTNNDGLVGLGFSSINTVQPKPQQTFFENIMPHLALPVFTANLEEDASGTYTFGEIDASQYAGDIHYTDIDSSKGFWQFASPSYAIGNVSTPCKTCSPAIADTGTSLILVDDDVVTAYYAQVAGAALNSVQGGYVYPCSSKLPSFGISLGGGYMATVTGANITFAQIDSQNCFGGIQSNGGAGLMILGDMLFKHYFAVFDGGNKSFGLAEKN